MLRRLFLSASALLIATPAVAQFVPVDTNNPPPPLTNPFGSQADISDGLNRADLVSPRATLASNTGEVNGVGAYRMICGPGPVRADDPVAMPGMPAMSHTHQFYGNTGVTANSTYATLRSTGKSTCHNSLGGWRSAYWQNTVVRGDGKLVQPFAVSAYYKRYPLSSPQCTPGDPLFIGRCILFPNGLRFIAGYNVPEDKADGSTYFKCVTFAPGDSAGVTSIQYSNMVDAAANCPSGPTGSKYVLDLGVDAPFCLQSDGNGGIRLDSPNHRDHVAYASPDANSRLKCPASHPYQTWHYTLQILYEMDNTINRSGTWFEGQDTWYMSTDRQNGIHSMGGTNRVKNYKPGTTFHFDLFDAARQEFKQLIEDNCINRLLTCTGGDFGNGEGLKQDLPNPTLVQQLDRIVTRPKLRYETFKARVVRTQ